jgi:Protein of unknown function (DUF2933)
MNTGRDETKPFLRTPAGIALLAFLAVAAFFLWTEHRAHLLGVLPWLLLAACPLMHLFMHGGHGGHGDHQGRGNGDGPGGAHR